jgi:hypothetical protein
VLCAGAAGHVGGSDHRVAARIGAAFARCN